MATRLEDEFDPTRINAPDAAYPAGSLKDETTPGVSDDGTPLASRVGNDWQGFSQSALDKAGIAANGQPDSVSNPQILQAIEQMYNDGDSQLARGNIWPLSSQDSLSVNDPIPSGTEIIRLIGGDFSSISTFRIVPKDGSFTIPFGNLDSFSLVQPYEAVIDGTAVYLAKSSFSIFSPDAYGPIGNDLLIDSTPSFQAANDVAYGRGVNDQVGQGNEFIQSSPAIDCVGKFYKLNGTISATNQRSLTIKGNKSVIVGNITNDFLNSTNMRNVVVSDVWFVDFDTIFDGNTGNFDGAQWTFTNVNDSYCARFINTQTYASSRSTIGNFINCKINCLGSGVFGTSYFDVMNFEGCWFQWNISEPLSFITLNSLAKFTSCLFIPFGTGSEGAAWVELTDSDGDGGTTTGELNRSVTFDTCRVSNEGSNPVLLLNNYANDTNTQNRVGINFHNCPINAFHPFHYENGSTETGIVHLLKYPAAISFTGGCTFNGLGDPRAQLVSRQSTLTDEAMRNFHIYLDEPAFRNAKWVAGTVQSYTIAKSLAQYVNSPDNLTYRGGDLADNGTLNVTVTNGIGKMTFNVRSDWAEPTFASPIMFYILTSGYGSDVNYVGSSLYIVTINGGFTGSPLAYINSQKIYGEGFGINEALTADVISAHFGSGDTGPNTAARASEYEITITFGAAAQAISTGAARILPITDKLKERGNQW